MGMIPSSHDRSWIQDTLAHRVPRAVPYNFMFSPPAKACLSAHLGTSDLESALGLPLRFSGPWSRKPLYAAPAEFGPRISDEFGVTWSTNDIDRGAPIDAQNLEGSSALYQAAENGRLPVVRLLVERGARLDIRDTIYEGTPLAWAQYGGRREVAAFLRSATPPRIDSP